MQSLYFQCLMALVNYGNGEEVDDWEVKRLLLLVSKELKGDFSEEIQKIITQTKYGFGANIPF